MSNPAKGRACRNCTHSQQMYHPCEVFPTCSNEESPLHGRVHKDEVCPQWEKRLDDRTAPIDQPPKD